MKQTDFSVNSVLQKQKALQSATDIIQSSPSWAVLQQLKVDIGSSFFAQLRQEVTQMNQLQPYLASALSIQRQIETVYAPLKEATKGITSMTVEWAAALQTSKAFGCIPQLNISELSRAAQILQNSMHSISLDRFNITEEELRNYCAEGDITPGTVAEAVEAICTEVAEEKLTVPDRIDKVKRTNWFFALTIIWMILSFLGKPAIDHFKDDILESFGVTQFWEQSGIYEWLDQLFSAPSEGGAISEDEAKASIDAPIGNMAKAKREELLGKISAIRAYIAAAPQDENTGNLMTYLSELEKELGAKKYGLVFEEHRETIDGVLEKYTPVLAEDKPRFIDNGGEMNFLLEGDNLAALQLLEKTHRGKIDLIYIDPPYNTGKKDFTYSDEYIAKDDSFRHSKWLSFMRNRLQIAWELLSDNGFIFISIDDNEQANLKMLCDSVFGETNFAGMFIVENNPKGRKNSNFISLSNDYCLAYVKNSLKCYFVENIPKDIKDLSQDEDGKYVHSSGKRVLVGENEFNDSVQDFESEKHYSVYYKKETNEIRIQKEYSIDEVQEQLIQLGYTRYYSYNNAGFVLNTYTWTKLLELFSNGALD